MARLRASWRTSLPVAQQPRNPQSESIARTPYHVVEAAVALCRDQRIDAVVSIGGGSALDTAKLVAYLARSGDRLDDIYGVGLAKGQRLPLLLAPTTAGTGSEVTPIAI